MSKQLYEEALADVKKLKEVAEDNAKKALLEAVTPRIKDLIENQLLGEAAVDDDKLLFDELPHEPVVASAKMSTVQASEPQSDDITVDLDSLKDANAEDEYELSLESASTLKAMIAEKRDDNFSDRLAMLQKKIDLVAAAGDMVRQTEGYSNMIYSSISEVEDMYSYLQDKMQETSDKKKYESVLENHYSTLKQLTERKMNKKNSTLSEADVTLKLTGMPDDLDLDSVGVDLVTDDVGDEGDEGDEDLDLGGEQEEEESDEDLESDEADDADAKMESVNLSDDVVVEIDEGMLRREIKRMKALREEDETKVQSWGHGAGDVSDDFAEDETEVLDVELTTEGEDEDDEDDDLDEAQDQVDDLDEADMDQAYMDELDEADMDQAEDDRKHGGNVAPDSMGPGAKSNKQKRHTESLEQRLEAEKAIQSEAKKKAQRAKKMQSAAQKKAQQSKKMQEKQAAKKQAKKMQEAYAFFATKFNESVARSNKLSGMLSEAAKKGTVKNDDSTRTADESSSLRKKLAETNLFNAKLLFTNKLLQNESLTRRQKAEVIERLDEACTEREVKLVYESLVKALQGSTTKRVNESSTPAPVVGSSSRPVRPASTLNEGFEADRWARLAGIVK